MLFLRKLFLALALSIAPFIVNADQVNINTADAATIAAEMNGLGECRAKVIIRYREQVGKFKSIDELENVSGIGYKTVEKNRDSIHL